MSEGRYIVNGNRYPTVDHAYSAASHSATPKRPVTVYFDHPRDGIVKDMTFTGKASAPANFQPFSR